jgi:hypothetical protein
LIFSDVEGVLPILLSYYKNLRIINLNGINDI